MVQFRNKHKFENDLAFEPQFIIVKTKYVGKKSIIQI